MRGTSILVLAAVLAGSGGMTPLAAQGRINPRLAQSQPPKYVQGLCPLRPGHKSVENGISALRKAYDEKDPAKKTALLQEARQSLITSVTTDGQSANGAAWYYLARVALMRGDPFEADSGFTKAEQLVPACEIDISGYRQNSWASLGSAGIDLQRAGQIDSALAQFRDASVMFRGLPHVLQNMGVIYANSGQNDSAAVYFEKSLAIAAADSTLTEDRNGAAQNLALMYIRLNKHAEAIKVLHRTVAWDNEELNAKSKTLDSLQKASAAAPVTPAVAAQVDTLKAQVAAIQTRLGETEKSMAITFRNAGMTDSAEAIESKLIAKFSATNLDSLETGDILTVGAAAFNAGKYGEAEKAFGKVAERNPWSRDASYNLSITHLAVSKAARDSAEALRVKIRGVRNPPADVRAAVADTTRLNGNATAAFRKLVTEAARLLEIDPMNEDALRLLAQAQRGLNQDSASYKTAERLVALPFSVDVTLFQMGMTRANLVAEATGREAMDPNGKALKVDPVAVTFEFLDAKGTVLDTKEITVPVLTKGQKHTVTLEGKGSEIAGWRYRRKPA